MPWHRNPIDAATGQPKMTSVPIEGSSPNELSFQYDDAFLINDLIPPPNFKKLTPPGTIKSIFDQDNNVELSQEISRLKSTKRRGNSEKL